MSAARFCDQLRPYFDHDAYRSRQALFTFALGICVSLVSIAVLWGWGWFLLGSGMTFLFVLPLGLAPAAGIASGQLLIVQGTSGLTRHRSLHTRVLAGVMSIGLPIALCLDALVLLNGGPAIALGALTILIGIYIAFVFRYPVTLLLSVPWVLAVLGLSTVPRFLLLGEIWLDTTGYLVAVAVWYLLLMPTLVPASIRLAQLRGISPPFTSTCLRCGYDRTGIGETAPCPECGKSPSD